MDGRTSSRLPAERSHPHRSERRSRTLRSPPGWEDFCRWKRQRHPLRLNPKTIISKPNHSTNSTVLQQIFTQFAALLISFIVMNELMKSHDDILWRRLLPSRGHENWDNPKSGSRPLLSLSNFLNSCFCLNQISVSETLFYFLNSCFAIPLCLNPDSPD